MFIQKKKNILKIYTRVSMTLNLLLFIIFHQRSSCSTRIQVIVGCECLFFQMQFFVVHICVLVRIFVVFMSLTSFYLYATKKKNCWLDWRNKKKRTYKVDAHKFISTNGCTHFLYSNMKRYRMD